MKFFNVPADYKNSTIDRYNELNNNYRDSKIIETYGQLTVNNSFGSGRPNNILPTISLTQLQKYISYSSDKGIGFNYTLNSTCLGNMEFTDEGIRSIVNFLDKLYKIGVKTLTIALPSLIDLVQYLKYDFKIKVSTVSFVTNVNKALYYKKMGVNAIVVHESVNRKFDVLKNIGKAFGENVEVIVNSICHKDCIYEIFHRNSSAHNTSECCSESSNDFFSFKCMSRMCEDASSILKLGWIRPEDIPHYMNSGISHFKIQGRQMAFRGDPAKVVECYMKESYNGNFLDLLYIFSHAYPPIINISNKQLDGFIKPFLSNKNFCKNNCDVCNYCHEFLRKNIDYQKFSNALKSLNNLYTGRNFFNTNTICKK